MSNYLITIATNQILDKIELWLSKLQLVDNVRQTDIVRVPLDSSHGIVILSKGAIHDTDALTGVYFRGYGIDYLQRSILFGGNNSVKQAALKRKFSGTSMEGCYISCTWTADGRVIDLSNDLFNLCPMFNFQNIECAAFSDSVYLLRELRRALDLPTSLNATAAIARGWSNAMGGQMLSVNSLIDQIKMVPMGEQVQVNLGSGLTVSRVAKPLPELFSLSGEASYGSTIKEAAVNYVSLLDTLAGLGPGKVRMAVSGGLDSRANIAAALLSPNLRQNGTLTCQNSAPQHQTDFEVVSEIGAAFGIPVNQPLAGDRPRAISTIPESLGLWFLSSAGIYDFMVLPNRIVTENASFNVGGHGAEMVKGQYGWRSVKSIARQITNKKISSAFLSETEIALNSIGVPFDDDIGSEWHYVGHRNSLHSGRFVTTSMLGLRPFMTKNLLSLERSGKSGFRKPSKGEPNIIQDLLLALHPEISMHRYDVANKNIDRNLAEKRLRLIGGPLSASEIETFSVIGDPDDIKNGHSMIFAAIAGERTHWTPVSRNKLEEYVIRGGEIASDHGLDAIYGPIAEEARNKLSDEAIPLKFARASIGKLVGFHLLD